MSSTHDTPELLEARRRRVTQAEVLRALLERGSTEHDSVTLARNAKGNVQIEVVVRTGNEAGVATIEEAAQLARDVYDRLVEAYPFAGDESGAKGSS